MLNGVHIWTTIYTAPIRKINDKIWKLYESFSFMIRKSIPIPSTYNSVFTHYVKVTA